MVIEPRLFLGGDFFCITVSRKEMMYQLSIFGETIKMKSIFVTGDTVVFKLGENATAFDAVVMDMNPERKTISESVVTMIYYDLDVYYDRETSQHTTIKHVHEAFVLFKTGPHDSVE